MDVNIDQLEMYGVRADNYMGVYCLHRVKHAAKGSGLKAGVAYIYVVASQSIVREVALFLYEEYHLRLSSVFTQINVVNAIWQWLEFNAAAELDWKEADAQVLLDYRDLMLASTSVKTGRPYANGTVAARMIAVIMLYRYLSGQGVIVSDIADMQGERRELCSRQFGRSPVLSRNSYKKSGYIPRADGRLRISPFTKKQLQSFLQVIGPRASLNDLSDSRLSRDRLIVDFGWAVGLRNSEITGLKVHQFTDLRPDACYPGDCQRLEIFGKRRKIRVVAVPNWLVADAQAYIAVERAQAVNKSKEIESEFLVVSSRGSRFPGRKISTRRTLQIVESACTSAGQVATIKKVLPGLGNVYVNKALHCVHDLRHTYAVMTYHAEVKQGNREPWKKIQAQLGHESMQITIDTYLRYVSVFDLE